MFMFSVFIIFYFAYLGYKYIPMCCFNLKNEVKYGLLMNWKERYEKYVNRFELSKAGLTNIKDELLKSNLNDGNFFPISESIMTLNIEDFNANLISDLMVDYKNVREWGAVELGNVIYILNTTPLKTTRAYMRNIRCFHILLDEFIYYIYKNLNSDIVKNKFGNSHMFLKLLICCYGLSNGENNRVLQDYSQESGEESDQSDQSE